MGEQKLNNFSIYRFLSCIVNYKIETVSFKQAEDVTSQIHKMVNLRLGHATEANQQTDNNKGHYHIVNHLKI